MKLSEAFPSKYLSAPDIGDREIRLVIGRIEIEKIGRDNDEKPVVYFTKAKKGLVLNKTNGKMIAGAYGEEMDQWEDKEVILFTMMVQFGDEMVDSIRVKIPKMAAPAKPAPTRAVAAQPDPMPDNYDPADDDEIPF